MDVKELRELKIALKRDMLDEMLQHVTHYRTDIVYDFDTVDVDMAFGIEYVWLLRETGTDLNPIQDLMNPNSWASITFPRAQHAYRIKDFKFTKVPLEEIEALIGGGE